MAHIAVSPTDQRSAARIGADAAATLRIDSRPLDATVLDISLGGIRIRTEQPLTIGRRVHVGAGGRQLGDATVVWAAGTEHGLEFDAPLAPQDRDAVHCGAQVIVGPFLRASAPPPAPRAPGIGTSAGLVAVAGITLVFGVAAAAVAAPFVFLRRIAGGE